MSEEILTATKLSEDEDSSLRPQALKEYIGQQDLKDNLDEDIIAQQLGLTSSSSYNYDLNDFSTVQNEGLLQQIEDETASQFRERNIQLQMNVPEALPMRGDASLIYSLFRNIFSNALAYASEATYFRVEAEARHSALFTFSDNGPGIPADIQSKIFMPNFTTKSTGTGLGLAISKNIVEACGGHITFETSEKGTTFLIYLIKPKQ